MKNMKQISKEVFEILLIAGFAIIALVLLIVLLGILLLPAFMAKWMNPWWFTLYVGYILVGWYFHNDVKKRTIDPCDGCGDPFDNESYWID